MKHLTNDVFVGTNSTTGARVGGGSTRKTRTRSLRGVSVFPSPENAVHQSSQGAFIDLHRALCAGQRRHGIASRRARDRCHAPAVEGRALGTSTEGCGAYCGPCGPPLALQGTHKQHLHRRPSVKHWPNLELRRCGRTSCGHGEGGGASPVPQMGRVCFTTISSNGVPHPRKERCGTLIESLVRVPFVQCSSGDSRQGVKGTCLSSLSFAWSAVACWASGVPCLGWLPAKTGSVRPSNEKFSNEKFIIIIIIIHRKIFYWKDELFIRKFHYYFLKKILLER